VTPPCRLSLNTMTLTIDSASVYTQLGVAISVTGVAQVLPPSTLSQGSSLRRSSSASPLTHLLSPHMPCSALLTVQFSVTVFMLLVAEFYEEFSPPPQTFSLGETTIFIICMCHCSEACKLILIEYSAACIKL
jgi:hypothetical protein